MKKERIQKLNQTQKIIEYVSFPIALIIFILGLIIKEKIWIILGSIFSVITFIKLMNIKRG